MKRSDMNFKSISDLGLVSALMTLGYSPHDRNKEGRRVTFIFETNDEIERIEKDFFNNRLDVDARTFHSTMKSVKNSIYRKE